MKAPSPAQVAILGGGTLLLWAAVKNQNPLDVVRSAVKPDTERRPLSTGAGRLGASVGADASTPVVGGIAGGAAAAGIGGAQASWQAIVSYLLRVGITPKVGSTTGGKHSNGSLHYQGRAVDFPGSPGAGPDAELDRIYAALVPLARAGKLEELFWAGGGYDGGIPIRIGGHADHVHAGIAKGATL